MTFAERMRSGETIYSIWSSIGSPMLVSQLAYQPFDGVVIDMQHGSHSDDTIVSSAEHIIAADKIAITRVPVDRFDAASRALDLGYEAVIAPMINNKHDAQKLAEFMKYPPLGGRSYGPTKALQMRKLTAEENLAIANQKTLAFAMIETREAYNNFDEIINVDGVDGIFVGPSDLSLTFSNGQLSDPNYEGMQDALLDMPKRAKAAGKFSGIFGGTPEIAKKFANMGYNLVNISLDTQLIAAGAADFRQRAGV